MAYQLDFSVLVPIDEDDSGMRVPIKLASGAMEIKIDAYFDSGAKYCVFPHWVGAELGLDLEDGEPIRLRTGGGLMQAYLHYGTLRIADLIFEDVPFCIAKYPDFNRCLLGRSGWLPKTRFGLVAYDGQLFLGRHGE